MHKIYEYLCDELKTLEKKAESGQGLSMSEIEYLDKLTETKKNLLKIEMLEEDSEYSNADGGNYTMRNSYRGSYGRDGRGSYDNGSYARDRGRGARRDSIGRYSSEGYSRAEDFKMELEDLMQSAPNDRVRQKMQSLMAEM